MRMTRFVRMQLIVFTIVSVVAALIVALAYLRLPSLLFGVGRYTVTVELPEAATDGQANLDAALDRGERNELERLEAREGHAADDAGVSEQKAAV